MGKRIIIKDADFSMNGIYGETPEPIVIPTFVSAPFPCAQRGEDQYNKTILIADDENQQVCVADVSALEGRDIKLSGIVDASDITKARYAFYGDDSNENENIQFGNIRAWNAFSTGWGTHPNYPAYRCIYPAKPSFIDTQRVDVSNGELLLTIRPNVKWLLINQKKGVDVPKISLV